MLHKYMLRIKPFMCHEVNKDSTMSAKVYFLLLNFSGKLDRS